MRTTTVTIKGRKREIAVVDYGDFEIEVGSTTYERLVKQGLITPVPHDEIEATVSRELNDLTLAELRQRAAILNIDHRGLKKDALIEAIEAADELAD